MKFDFLFELSNRTRVILSVITIALSALVLMGAYSTDRDAPRIGVVDLHQVNHTVSPMELASWIIENKRDFEILDLRDPDSFEKEHIKNAANCQTCHENKNQALDGNTYIPNFNKKIVIYTQSGKEDIHLPRVLINRTNLLHLEGGYDAWEKEILNPGKKPETLADMPAEKRSLILSISNFFLGKTDIAAPPPVQVDAPKKVHTLPTFGNQGC